MTLALQNPSLLQTQAFINGQWRNADSGATFAVHNPATGELIAQVANVAAGETRTAIAAAEQAMRQWRTLAAAERAALLERWYQLMLDNANDLAHIMTAEQGKPLAEALGEIKYGASYVKWFAEEGRRIYGDVLPSPADRRSLVIKQPIGVVAAITPWNFPNAMITRKIAPALAAGCSVVLKPAAETPLSALAIAYLATEAGIPAGLINIVPTIDAPAVGAEMTSNPTVRKLTFTGSTAVGKLLTEQCARTMKRTSMELGGNAPVIVFNDADLDQAVNGALLSKFRNSGQTCICANRILVQDGIFDAFADKFTAAVKNFRLGNGFEQTTTHGPVITEKAAQDIHAKVNSALTDGATLLTGGKISDLGPQFYEPTVLVDVHDQMRLFKEEVFGPVAPLFRFSTEEEAIAMANDTEFGLASYLFTKDIGRIWRVSEGIEYGMVGVNETMIGSEVIPFGGVKESGQGREGSKYGLEDYLEIKYICLGGL